MSAAAVPAGRVRGRVLGGPALRAVPGAVLVGAVLVGAAACAGPAALGPPPPPAASAAATTAAAADTAACAQEPGTVATVRKISEVARQGPVLPAAVALFLWDARQKAAAPGVTDPALRAARQQLVTAIDDLDAQGRAALPPGGNPARDAVRLDPTRALAAADALERACAAVPR